jgi:hypothetical protein
MARNDDEITPAEVQKYLKGVSYPARKDDLITAARGNGAPDEVIELLERLPGDQFDGPPEVMKAYGEVK